MTFSAGAMNMLVEDKRTRAIVDDYSTSITSKRKETLTLFFGQSIDHRSTCRTCRTRGIFRFPTPAKNATSFTSLSE
jgi:hypothetical protein